MSLPLNQIVCGDAFQVLKGFPESSIDCLVTDPPYGLSFMGKDWDRAVPCVEVWRECLRVLKAGSFAFIMSSPRLDCLSQMAVRLEQAGFDVGFTPIYWAYASGFPKAMNISKAVDKRNARNYHPSVKNYLNQQRLKKCLSFQQVNEYLGVATSGGGVASTLMGDKKFNELPTAEVYAKLKILLELDNRFDELIERTEAEREVVGKQIKARSNGQAFALPTLGAETKYIEIEQTVSTTEQAKSLDGCFGGFQPKPAVEVIIVAMKPLSEKSFIDQALKNQKGCTWLDDARIPFDKEGITKGGFHWQPRNTYGKYAIDGEPYQAEVNQKGRFPANLLCQDDVLNDGRTMKYSVTNGMSTGKSKFFGEESHKEVKTGYCDEGSFSRYFDLDKWFEAKLKDLPESVRHVFPFLIVPKASKEERNSGLEKSPKQFVTDQNKWPENDYRKGCGEKTVKPRGNFHPTVKPIKLMSYLITLGSRPNDIILDPYVGSGTTAIASRLLNRHYIGVDNNPAYVEIAKNRLATIPQRLDAST